MLERTGLSFTGMAARWALEAAGGFDTRFSVGADIDLAWRLARRHGVAAVPGPLALYRLHPGQMHLDLGALEDDGLRLLDRALADGETGDADALRRRARANLYTRLSFYELKRRNVRRARRAVRLAAGQRRPDRMVSMSAWAAATRARNRLRTVPLATG